MTVDRARELLTTPDGRRVLSEAVATLLGHWRCPECGTWFPPKQAATARLTACYGKLDGAPRKPPPYASVAPTAPFYWPACGEMIGALRKACAGVKIQCSAVWVCVSWTKLPCNAWRHGYQAKTLRDALILAFADCGMLAEQTEEPTL